MDLDKVEPYVHDARKIILPEMNVVKRRRNISRTSELLDKKRKRMNMRREHEERASARS
jgi:hypothetical protein